MANRLEKIGRSAAWWLLVNAAIEGAESAGYSMKRKPGRGLSNTYEMTKDGKTQIASIRTTRDRFIAFPPLDGGKRWKTLDAADLVLVATVDDPENPQRVDVHLFPGDEVRRRFDAAYATRIANGHTIRDDFGMWLMIDKGDDQVPSQVGHSLAIDYPAIAQYALEELETEIDNEIQQPNVDIPLEAIHKGHRESYSALSTVADVLTFAREKIAALTGMPTETIKLDLKMGV